jgi:type III restriction enzyme
VRLPLKDFQDIRVAELASKTRLAVGVASAGGGLQAISFAAPTGSGKTVMATALIERLLEGDEDAPPLDELAVLWISDQPELNQQTFSKMLLHSSALEPSQLKVVSASNFDQRVFGRQRVYFVNTQKLAKGAGLVDSEGDYRTHTFWQTVANTVEAGADRLLIIIDEAHRGMRDRNREQAETIIQKFIKGSAGEMPPVPVLLGMTATPERFDALLAGGDRTKWQVTVTADEVRSSGLLKDVVSIRHTDETQPSDVSLLRLAAKDWKVLTERWATYCDEEDEPRTIRPLLMVQVQDRRGSGEVTATELAEAVQAIEAEVDGLGPSAFAHAFPDAGALEIAGRKIRHLAPADIDRDPHVLVVFFKESLNTGWDCPRAEVMMSYRPARDATYIAQLVGRMVRTPLARRIEKDESLNAVSLYLPHYDRSNVGKVVEKLTGRDDEDVPIDVEDAANIVELTRAPGSDVVFELLAKLPTYVGPVRPNANQVNRVMKLAALLSADEIEPDAPKTARALLVQVLLDRRAEMAAEETYNALIEDRRKITVRTLDVALRPGLQGATRTEEIEAAPENVDDLFRAARRRLREGLRDEYFRHRVKVDDADPDDAKIEAFLLANDGDALSRLESTARSQTEVWLDSHDAAIDALPEGRRQPYEDILGLAAEPEKTKVRPPDTVRSKKSDVTWSKHLYVDEHENYPDKLGTWEAKTIEEEMGRDDFVAWLRNPSRKPWSLRVPYKSGGEWSGMFPDLLVFRTKEGGGLAVDILDPHTHSLADAADKARGLAEFADRHFNLFGRIELIRQVAGKLQRVDLRQKEIRDDMKAVSGKDHLDALFDRWAT